MLCELSELYLKRSSDASRASIFLFEKGRATFRKASGDLSQSIGDLSQSIGGFSRGIPGQFARSAAHFRQARAGIRKASVLFARHLPLLVERRRLAG